MAELNRAELQSKMIMLTEKYEKRIKEYEKQLTEKGQEIESLKKELSGVKLSSTIHSSDEDKIRKVLSFHAQLLSITDIYEKMR
jgi:predicted RNase H-like nuclease (RuvC/YqgF family)